MNIRTCSKVIFLPLYKHRWERPFDTVIIFYYIVSIINEVKKEGRREYEN